ncbi:hypothetical protein HK099_003227 [Clydaea vesicula]|uniref:Uncharacterized protein n=1 Tax=Clydaea vesicula TaxID=447962 RepID=A0AAD5TSE1_9FUNG|nr:hypothetical protein HK099_003227 [Clydaea vesicula]
MDLVVQLPPQSNMEKSTSQTSLSSSPQTPSKFSKMVTELGKKIGRRAEVSELAQKNILKGSIKKYPCIMKNKLINKNKPEEELASPSIAQAKADLEKARTQDILNRRISNRSSKVDLKLRNILRVDSNDTLDQSGVSLEKNINFDKKAKQLKSCLRQRPEKSELQDMNIIRTNENLDPSIAAAQMQLQKRQLEHTLEAKLRDRPNLDEVSTIINFSEVVEVLPTFRKSEYNRKPDTNATFKKLTPQMKVMIREELNNFKKSEMPVHEESNY